MDIDNDVKEQDSDLLKQFLTTAGSPVPLPPLVTRIALLRANMALWQNSYFSACDNLRTAHAAQLQDAETRFFQEAKQMRVAFQTVTRELDDLLAEQASQITQAQVTEPSNGNYQL